MSDKKPFINTYRAMYGWKNQFVVWNEEGFYEPWETDYFQFPDERIEEAMRNGIIWALNEGVSYIAPKGYEDRVDRLTTEAKLVRRGYDLEELEQDNPYNGGL